MKETFREQVKKVRVQSTRLVEVEAENAALRARIEQEVNVSTRFAAEVERLTAIAGENPDAAESIQLHRVFMAEARLALAESTFGRIFTRAKAKVSPKVFG